MPYKYQDQWHVKMRALNAKLEQRKRLKSTLVAYRTALTTIWNLLGKPENPLDVTIKEYMNLEKKMQELEYKTNTIAEYLTKLKYFLKFVNHPDVGEFFIYSKMEPKEDRVFLEETEIIKEREIAHSLGAKYELVYSLAVDNSLRRADICNIKLSEANMLVECGQTYITQKGGGRRYLVLHRNTMEPLILFLKERQDAQDAMEKKGIHAEPYLFINFRTGKHTADNTIYRWVKKVSDTSGMYFRPHDLRATFVRRHSRANTRPEIVMNLTGHKSWNTTFNWYYGKDINAMKDAQNRI